jgi:hypothetical protein
MTRLGQWLDVVFLKWRHSWAWLGVLVGTGALFFRLLPTVRPEWLTPLEINLSGILAFVVVMLASFAAWREERDRYEGIIDKTHLVLDPPSAVTNGHWIDFLFRFKNDSPVPLSKLQVFVRLSFNDLYIDQKQSELANLGGLQSHDVHFVFDENTTVPFPAVGEKDIAVIFEINSYYERPDHRRWRGPRLVFRFEPLRQTFEKTAQQEPEAFPAPPTTAQIILRSLVGMSDQTI